MASIGVITTCHTYLHWLPEWAMSVKALHRQPDKIVIASTELPGPLPVDYSWVQPEGGWDFGRYLNAAVKACNTDWVVWIGADDKYFPHALSGWEDGPADVIAFGVADMDDTWAVIREPFTAEEVFSCARGNIVSCGSPFRRWLWEGVPFRHDTETPFNDWAFWISAAAQGAVFATTGRADYRYRVHPEQVRVDEKPFADEIKDWRDRTFPTGVPRG